MVLVEPLIKSSGGAVKPDLVFWNSEASYVLDVAVEGNGFDPDTRHERKLAKYYVVLEITALVRRSRIPFSNANQLPMYTALVSNWRGMLSQKSSFTLMELGCFRKMDMKLLSVAIVEQST